MAKCTEVTIHRIKARGGKDTRVEIHRVKTHEAKKYAGRNIRALVQLVLRNLLQNELREDSSPQAGCTVTMSTSTELRLFTEEKLTDCCIGNPNSHLSACSGRISTWYLLSSVVVTTTMLTTIDKVGPDADR